MIFFNISFRYHLNGSTSFYSSYIINIIFPFKNPIEKSIIYIRIIFNFIKICPYYYFSARIFFGYNCWHSKNRKVIGLLSCSQDNISRNCKILRVTIL